jgi:hypothetical protein
MEKRLKTIDMPKSSTTWWRLRPSFAAIIVALFASHAKMHVHLETNAVTWKSATVGTGVSKATAINLIKSFFETLHNQAHEGFKGGAGIYGHLASRLHATYLASMGLEPDYDQYLEEVLPQKS